MLRLLLMVRNSERNYLGLILTMTQAVVPGRARDQEDQEMRLLTGPRTVPLVTPLKRIRPWENGWLFFLTDKNFSFMLSKLITMVLSCLTRLGR